MRVGVSPSLVLHICTYAHTSFGKRFLRAFRLVEMLKRGFWDLHTCWCMPKIRTIVDLNEANYVLRPPLIPADTTIGTAALKFSIKRDLNAFIF